MPDATPEGRVPPEKDAEVQRALQAFHLVLCGLEGLIEEEPVEQASPSPCAPVCGHRWIVSLRGVRRLTRAAAMRERLARLPGCLASQVADVSPREVRFALTTSRRVSSEVLEFVVAEAVSRGDASAFEVLPRRPDMAR